MCSKWVISLIIDWIFHQSRLIKLEDKEALLFNKELLLWPWPPINKQEPLGWAISIQLNRNNYQFYFINHQRNMTTIPVHLHTRLLLYRSFGSFPIIILYLNNYCKYVIELLCWLLLWWWQFRYLFVNESASGRKTKEMFTLSPIGRRLTNCVAILKC